MNEKSLLVKNKRTLETFFVKHHDDNAKNVVPPEGLEPSTTGLKGHCSTIEL